MYGDSERVEERRVLKGKIDNAKSERTIYRYREQYSDKDKEVKKSMRKDKIQWINGIANEAQEAANIGNMKTVYDVTKLLLED